MGWLVWTWVVNRFPKGNQLTLTVLAAVPGVSHTLQTLLWMGVQFTENKIPTSRDDLGCTTVHNLQYCRPIVASILFLCTSIIHGTNFHSREVCIWYLQLTGLDKQWNPLWTKWLVTIKITSLYQKFLIQELKTGPVCVHSYVCIDLAWAEFILEEFVLKGSTVLYNDVSQWNYVQSFELYFGRLSTFSCTGAAAETVPREEQKDQWQRGELEMWYSGLSPWGGHRTTVSVQNCME